MPTAQSLYFNNREKINGALLDTTFSLMPNYKTSITMISSLNLGKTLRFSFGENKTKELYDCNSLILFPGAYFKYNIVIEYILTQKKVICQNQLYLSHM